MRIVHLCLGGPVVDGWNYQDNLLPKYHKKAGHDVIIIASKWIWGNNGEIEYFDKSDYVNEDGIKVIRLDIKHGKDIRYKFKKYLNLDETLDKCKPDILFIHGVSYLDVKTASKFLKKNPKVIAYADNHGDLTNSGTNWFSKKILHGIIWKNCAQSLIPYVKKFYGVLPIRVDFLVDIYKIPRERCELLVLGADDELVEAAQKNNIRGEIRKRYGIDENDFLIITGGKIDAFKTQTLLLMEAVRRINNSKIKLIVFGSVSEELKKKVNNLSDENLVQYIGWVKSQDSYQYFAASDLVVFPGRHSVFWEQVVAQGIPMMCNELPGTKHIDLGGNVIFLTENNAEEMQMKIEEIVNNPSEYAKMKQIAREKGMKMFSYRTIAMKSIEEQDNCD